MSTLRHTLPRVLLCLTVCLLPLLLGAQQRLENTLYQFCPDPAQNSPDGDLPFGGGLVADSQGNFYGTTLGGGAHDRGVVFELSPPPGGSGPWTESVLYSFCAATDCVDGQNPYAGVIFDSRGNLYGTTSGGGVANNGLAFELSPPAGGHGPWTENVIYSFCVVGQCRDGSVPEANFIFDSGGNLYGTTTMGGFAGYGTAFKLAPGGHGAWTETVLYAFCQLIACADGLNPGSATLAFDRQGNLYGTTRFGGDNNDGGIVYRLSPEGGQYGFWSESVLHTFCTSCGDGTIPYAGVVFDSQGNLYGTTSNNGGGGWGMIYELSPPPGGSGLWSETILENFGYGNGLDVYTALTLDQHGNLYGNASRGGPLGGGTAYELSPSGGAWTQNLLYSFCYYCSDSFSPNSAFFLDHQGNLYGTATGGAYQQGVVFELPWAQPTSTTLVTAPNPSDLQQNVAMTATVTAQDGSTPSGTVIFNSDGTQIGSASLNNSGVAVFNDSSLTPVPHTLTAAYQPSTNWNGSLSNSVIQVVNPWLASTTTVTSSPNPSTVGQSVTFTATVGPSGSNHPTGTVSFTSDGAPISGCTNLTLPYSLQVTCTSSNVPVGMNSIVATYSGDVDFGGSSGSMWQIVNPVPTPLQFITVAPCRLVDTRPQKGGNGPIQGGTAESFTVPQLGACNIPATATAFSLNVTAIPQGSLGYLTIWPTGENRPGVSILNSPDGRTKANAAVVAAGTNGAVSVYASDTTNLALDINGYFVTTSSLPGAQNLQFYTVPPCRVVDTRTADGPLAGPFLTAQVERDFPMLDSSCIPASANPQAYSLNFTVVPHPSGQQLGYLTVWPQGGAKPVVSTLNNPTATIVANAAIVPAGSSGGIAVYPDENTDLVVDINGYFAAPGGQNGLSLYVLAPCRVLDTRTVGNGQPFSGELTVNVAGSVCALAASAQAYIFNATVLPSGYLSYLTLWPEGDGQPVVSTLNAADGWVTSNMAIVPNVDGKIDAYAAGMTQLILDISAYFAP